MKIRLGRIEYVNVLPVYYALEQVFGENGFYLVSGPPAGLNERLRRGELDISPVSSLEWGRCPREYLLLPDLSISSRGPVGSVLFFSRRPVAELDGGSVRLSDASATGAALLKVLLEKRYGVRPRFYQGKAEGGPEADLTGVLAIGDDALRLRIKGAWPQVLDLGEAWHEWTGLPFVFGVWAVRRDFARQYPGEVAGLHRLLLRSRAWGLQALPDLSRQAAARLSLTAAEALTYFRQLDYSLGPDHEAGLARFFQDLAGLGELPHVPAVEYFSG
jgi:chorismate dehydratase